MSSIEERLARDIAAVTRGVVVTEPDLREARETLNQRIDSHRQRNRRIVTVAAAAAVVAVIGGVAAIQTLGGDDDTAPPAGPDATDAAVPDGTAPTPARIKGIWRDENSTTVIRFGIDGLVRFDQAGTLLSDPLDTGSYFIDGKQITVTTAGDTDPRCRRAELVVDAALTGEGTMVLAHQSATDAACSPIGVGEVWTLEQVLPTYDAPQGPELTDEEQRAMQLLVDRSLLLGGWVAQDREHLLELAPDGTYYVAGAGGDVVDQGEWDLSTSPSELVLTTEESVLCEVGDTLVISGLGYIDLGERSAMRGTVTQNACDAKWAVETWWALLPHSMG